jgi:hypothetical protein
MFKVLYHSTSFLEYAQDPLLTNGFFCRMWDSTNSDKISASTINKEYEHLSIELINACLFGVPAVSGYSLFQSDMSTKPEIQEVRSLLIGFN